jgi:anthranilate synthase component 2
LMRYEANFVKVKQMNKMRVLVVDFYDSFVFNLVHYFESFGCQVEVISDAEININDLDFLNGFQGITLSPGPGLPQETRSMMAIITYCRGRIPVLGVCLGMQGLGIDLGGTLYNLDAIRHGVSQTIVKQKDGFLLCDLPNQMDVGLYHSWAIKDIDPIIITAIDTDGVLMAIENPRTKQFGMQFHPESVMTSKGMEIVRNVLSKIF